jgi:hypothetical protein
MEAKPEGHGTGNIKGNPKGAAPKPRGKALAPKGGNDRICTPLETARLIVGHFKPCGRILEPCAGKGAFVQALNHQCEECEIDQGRDFMDWNEPVDWIITNPPWSKFRDFLRHAMEVSDNIVFLSLINAWFMRARQRDMQEMGFGLVEILHVPVPPPPWPQAGFSLGAGWLRRGWTGGIHFSRPAPNGPAKSDLNRLEKANRWPPAKQKS